MPLTTNCPACREPLEVDEEYRTWKVRCPSCRHEFTPDAGEPVAEEYIAAEPGDRPRRRRRRRMDDEEILDRAMKAVAGPASWLRVTGMLGVLAGVAGCVLAAVMGFALADNPAKAQQNFGQRQDELLVNTILVGVCSVFSLIFGGLMAIGAFKMGRLESHGWSITASVLAIASILFCTCCLFTGVPIGIWGLVALARPDVQEGFAIVARRKKGRHWVDEEAEESGF